MHRLKYGRKKEKLRKCFSTGARKNEEGSSLYIGSETLFKCLSWVMWDLTPFFFFFFKLSSFVLTIPKFVWPSFRRVSYDSEGLIEVSWSVVRFGVWCEEARTTPNLSNWCYRRLPYVIGGPAIRSLMWIWFTNVESLILTKI